MNNIYLVGFMATGKTHIGKALAKKKKRIFVDLDELIELRQGQHIKDIFAQHGEPFFRRLEKRTLREVAREGNLIVACGGGIVIDPENIAIMKDSGKVVCLTASPQVILKRASCSAERPLLNVPDPKRQIELLLKLRAPYYAKADEIVNTSRLSPKQVVEAVATRLLKKSRTAGKSKKKRRTKQ